MPGVTAYPTAIDHPSQSHVDATAEEILAGTTNDIAAMITAIETECGLNPSDVYADVAARLGIIELITFNFQTGTTYTPVLGDRSKCVSFNNAAGATFTIPPNSSVAFLVGTQIQVRASATAGTITIAPGSGVTLQSRGSSFAIAGPVGWVTLVKVATDTWDIVGDLA